MKYLAALALALFLAVPGLRAEQSPDDQYVIIYVLIQQGDASLTSGEPKQALGDYVEAQQELQKFQQVYSDWYPKIVAYRMGYLAEKIAALTPQSASTNAPPTNVPPPPTPSDWQSQATALNAQIRQLQGDNETLQSRLKEALSVQPAAGSAEAFAQIQQQLRDLAKENELLKTTVAQLTNTAPAVAPAPVPPNALKLQMDLAAQTVRANQLAQENDALEARVLTMTVDVEATEALRQENALLKKEMANLKLSPTASATRSGSSGDSASARAQISELQSEAAANWLEKAALENRIKQLQDTSAATAVQTAPTADLQSQVQELKRERDALLANLGEANKKLSDHKNKNAQAQMDALAQQIETLRDRVEVDEGETVPYTPEELALFTPEPLTADSAVEKKSLRQLPGSAAVLVAEAQSYFTNREYDQAAADYQAVVDQSAHNSLALANLAATELEQDKVAAADQHIRAALAQEPNDPFNLTVLGRVRFSEGNLDGALDALDRAVKLDPKNPQIQNFLGVAFAQKGLRVQAETAFRKAVQLDPDYGDAHKNLAIIYLSTIPPMVEMARWHYEKALAAGVPPNPDLEKMLNAGGGNSQPQ